jgi:MFS family permease
MAYIYSTEDIDHGVPDRVAFHVNDSLGLMSGPFLGAGLFYLFGYQWVFYSMGILLSFAIIPSILYLPNDNQEITKKQTFKSGTVFSNKNVIALALVVTMTSAGTTFINPMFSIHMETFNINETQSSLLLGSSTIAYIVFIHFVPALLKKFNKRLILTIGILLSALGDFIIAPVQIFPNNWWMVLVGLPIIGVANALCVLPSIPQFIEFIQQIYP